MRILLAGATGFLGSHLCRILQDQGHQLRLLVRDPARARQRWPAAEIVASDFAGLLRAEDWRGPLEGIDAAINAAGIIGGRAADFETVHVCAPLALFEAAEVAGVPRVIQISALGADETATTSFLRSKHAADRALAQRELHGCSVLPGLVFGAEGASARLFLSLASWPLLPLPQAGTQRVQPVHVDDVCAAVAALLQMPRMPPRLELVGPRCITLAEYLALLRAQLGCRPARVLRVPDGLARAVARVGDQWPALPLDSARLAMLARGNCADAAATERVLGHPPRPPERFLGGDAAMFRKRLRDAAALRLLRASVAAVWLITGVISLGIFPVADSLALLARCGLHGTLASVALYGAAALDIAFGTGTLLLPRKRWIFDAQIAVILAYSAIIAVCLPEFLRHPFAPVVKNLALLAAIWVLRQRARED